ncbi:uncharacterized protein si:ch73-303b9.1 [Danio rerio]|uniref:Uncharacterized protein si:ch73-303b9.1 n=1 Tax=Danio rerio TaxID=7955 RepID=A0ACD6B6C5_DANRE
MDAGRDRPELARSYEGPSWSDFDRGFCTDQSLSISTASSDGLLKPNKGIVLEYSEANPAVPPSLNFSTGLLSPLVALSKALSPGNVLNAALKSPVEGKSSTPYERMRFQKPVLGNSLDLSCVDLTASHPCWEVSLVKAIVESPKSCLESTWSPINQSAAPEASNVWSGGVSEDLQKSWREMIGQSAVMPELREKWSESDLAI